MPETGTFLSRDLIEHGSTYRYVGGNPVNLIDPLGFFGCDPITGECDYGYGLCVVQGQWRGAYVNGKPCIVDPINVQTGTPAPSLFPSSASDSPIQDYDTIHDDRDLTLWLFREIEAGIKNRDIKFIKKIMDDKPGGPIFSTFYLAGPNWTNLVKDEARYDFKHNIEIEMNRTILFRANDGTPIWTEFSVPGNIFFAYMSLYIGFPSWMVRAGAGKAQLEDHFKDGKSVCELLPTIPYVFDGPDDYRAISVGFQLYEKYGINLSLFQFRDELNQNRHNLTAAPDLPGNGAIPAYGWKNPRGGWPYQVGRFNGPKDAEFWPSSF